MEAFFAGLGLTVGESILAIIAIAVALGAWHVGRLVTKFESHTEKG